jgi:dihydroneopterin aldolase
MCTFAKIVEMSAIRLKNIKIYAFHGCMLEEGKIGSDYLVNLKVNANLKKAENSDNLHDTVDYVMLHKIVKDEMAIRSKLLEHVGKRIADKILLSISLVRSVKVTVAKVNPPIGGDVAEVSVAIFTKR